MNNYEVDLESKSVHVYGKLIEVVNENKVDWIIPGKYGFSSKIVLDISKNIQLNGDNYTLIQIPHQDDILMMLHGVAEQIKDEKWFKEKEKSKSEFSKVEQSITKAMHKFKLNDSSIIGLIGELTVLYKMLLNCDNDDKNSILDSWKGHSSTSRDFIFDDTCVEVKTTRMSKSTHHIHGLNQVDVTDDDGGRTQLFIASIGLEEDDEGESLSELVNKFADIDFEEGKLIQLLDSIKSYGVNSIGYDHRLMKNWVQFNVKFKINFERYYDMSDSNIKLPKHSDFDRMTHIVPKTLKFQIDLPDVVVEGRNPKDFFDFSELILKR
jgi:hypothetical protein